MNLPLNNNESAIRHELLVLCGYTPQVVTETLYAFYKHEGIQFDTVNVITSSGGKTQVERHLTGAGQTNMLQKLITDYGLNPIPFSEENILLVDDGEGQLLDHAGSRQELVQVGNFMLKQVKERTETSDTILHVSLSGGRKTYSYYLGYAMSVFARSQDTLNHVFVPTEYESSEFFYPTPNSQPIFAPGKLLDAKDAEVELVTIPLIRQRGGLPKTVLNGNPSFEQCVEICNSINYPVSLEVSLSEKVLICSGVEIKLPISIFAFYLVLLEDMLENNEGYQYPSKEKPNRLLAIRYLQARLKIFGQTEFPDTLDELVAFISPRIEEFDIYQGELDGLKNGMKYSFFGDKKSRVSTLLIDKLPKTVAEHYDIDILTSNKRGDARKPVSFFGIKLPRECVVFI